MQRPAKSHHANDARVPRQVPERRIVIGWPLWKAEMEWNDSVNKLKARISKVYGILDSHTNIINKYLNYNCIPVVEAILQ